eukprot:3062583-Rhodomonas_salina.1
MALALSSRSMIEPMVLSRWYGASACSRSMIQYVVLSQGYGPTRLPPSRPASRRGEGPCPLRNQFHYTLFSVQSVRGSCVIGFDSAVP